MLCTTCNYHRKPASDTNIEEGWIGCALRLRENHLKYHEFQIECEIQGEGWIRNCYLNANSGHLLNYQLLHKNVTSCNNYLPI